MKLTCLVYCLHVYFVQSKFIKNIMINKALASFSYTVHILSEKDCFAIVQEGIWGIDIIQQTERKKYSTSLGGSIIIP